MTESTFFPQFLRLPPELQTMVWKEFARDEAASRVVVVHNKVEVDSFTNTPRWVLHLMPLKRLVSPLLSVNLQSRQVALRHYNTPVNMYDLGPPIPWTIPHDIEEVANDTHYGRHLLPHRPPQYHFPNAPAWGPEHNWVTYLEYLVCLHAEERIDTGTEETLRMLKEAGSQSYSHRGCVHLDLESDRFLFYEHWRYNLSDRPEGYGFRALSEAMLDCKYHQVPFDLMEILERRPPVLRSASAELSPEFLGRIRNAVFENYETTSNQGGGGGGGGGGTGPAPATGGAVAGGGMGGSVVKANVLLTRSLPRAFSPEGSLGGFQTTPEMTRCFYDDIEDKGPAHLRIANAKLVRGPDDAEDEMGWLDWATDSEYDSDEEDYSDDDEEEEEDIIMG